MHNKQFFFYRTIAALLILSLLIPSIPLHAISPSQDDGSSGYTYQECAQIQQESPRDEIERIVLSVLNDENSTLDIKEVVGRKWKELRVDEVIDREVELATTEIYERESYWNRLLSGWSSDKAEEFANEAINEVFSSDAFSSTINQLSSAIAEDIAAEIESELARAASAALLCMQDYVGGAYSQTLFTAFERSVQQEIELSPLEPQDGVDVSLIEVHQTGLTGLGIIVVTEIVRRVAAKIGQKIAQRIAGKIAGRILGKAGSSLIPIAGWVIGIGLIAWDLIEGGKGALPQIQEALQAETVKEGIREEIVDAIEKGLPQEVEVVAKEIAVTTVEEWDSFCDTRPDLCKLAKADTNFQDILDDTAVEDLGELNNLIKLFVDNLGRKQLDDALDNGYLEKLVPAQPILLATQSVPLSLEWLDLAGDQLDQLIALDLYSRYTPENFATINLPQLLRLADNSAIDKMMALPEQERDVLLELPAADLRTIAANADTAELAWLAGYLPELAGDKRLETLTALSVNGVTIGQLQEMLASVAKPAPAPVSADETSEKAVEETVDKTVDEAVEPVPEEVSSQSPAVSTLPFKWPGGMDSTTFLLYFVWLMAVMIGLCWLGWHFWQNFLE